MRRDVLRYKKVRKKRKRELLRGEKRSEEKIERREEKAKGERSDQEAGV